AACRGTARHRLRHCVGAGNGGREKRRARDRDLEARRDPVRGSAPGRDRMIDAAEDGIERAAARAGRQRWVIVGLLFAATVINYVDRQMIGVLKPTLAAELHWSETDYANIVFFFQLAYA